MTLFRMYFDRLFFLEFKFKTGRGEKKNSEKNCKSILFGNDNTSLSAAKLNDRLAEF